jgi:neutral ceramidase
MPLTAGVARRDISPTKPMFLLGYPHVPRISSGIHDPLFAAALYLSDGAHSIMFVAVDVLMLPADVVRRCRAVISRACGIPAASILISATHTHSAPVTIELLAFHDDPVVPGIDDEYMDLVCRGICDAAAEAQATAVDAEAALTVASGAGVGGNRNDPQGAIDPEVGVLSLRKRATGGPLAISVVYSMHPTVLHEDSLLVSSDFPGYTRRYLEERLAGALVMYHTGPAGNQSPRYHVTAQTFAEAQRLGDMLGASVLAALQGLSDSDFSDALPVGAAQTFVELPVRSYPTLAESRQMLDQAVTEFEQLKQQGAAHGQVRTAECAVFGAEERIVLARAQESGEIDALRRRYASTEVQVLRVGPNAWVGLPGECFVEYALAIKRRAPLRSFVISLANGELQGYIVTPDAAGYEASFSLFKPQAGNILVDAALRLMLQL